MMPPNDNKYLILLLKLVSSLFEYSSGQSKYERTNLEWKLPHLLIQKYQKNYSPWPGQEIWTFGQKIYGLANLAPG